MTLEMALKEQFQAGEAKGLAKGREEGLAEGREEGRKEGFNAGYENSIAVLRDLKSGNSVEQITQKYQLDINQILEFQKFLQD